MTETEQEVLNPTQDEEIDAAAKDDKMKRIWRKLLVLPYFLGLIWTCLHPIASVLTGELKCRGWYIDEHSIEIKFAEVSSWGAPKHLEIDLPRKAQGLARLCDNFETNNTTNLSCHAHHGDSFHVATVVPLSNAVDPTEEAIVFVVAAPATGDWTTSTFHYVLLHSLQRLADPIQTPWLSKTFMLVSPSSPSDSLDDTVSTFLDAYLGSRQASSPVPPLPPKLSGALLRTMIVLDVQDNSKKGISRSRTEKETPGRTEFTILPQGRRGVLANMDLVFLIGQLFRRSMLLNEKQYPDSTFLAHGYTQQAKDVQRYLDIFSNEYLSLDDKTKAWAEEMANMGLFAYTMAMGPHPPHAPALDRGIDSITIQARFEGAFWRDPAVEMIQYLEFLVRGLSNLHERLHHSFTLYMLPTPKKFVSHVEYFLPNLLLLLPLAVRAFGLILWDIHGLHLGTVGSAILVTLSSMGVMLLSSVAHGSDIPTMNTWLFGLYALAALLWKTMVLGGQKKEDYQRILQSLQFVACTTAVYILVPIAFAHTSLSYLPSLLWTPLLAFPNYGSDAKGGKLLMTMAGVVLLLLTAPPVLLVPRIFSSYTTFVQFAYVPLHVQLLLLVMTRWLR
jgi:glycosylphosphatidylinositol transamidase